MRMIKDPFSEMFDPVAVGRVADLPDSETTAIRNDSEIDDYLGCLGDLLNDEDRAGYTALFVTLGDGEIVHLWASYSAAPYSIYAAVDCLIAWGQPSRFLFPQKDPATFGLGSACWLLPGGMAAIPAIIIGVDWEKARVKTDHSNLWYPFSAIREH